MSQRILICFLLLLTAPSCPAKQTEKDSLSLLVAAVDSVFRRSPDSVEYYGQLALPLALKLKDLVAETKIQRIRGARLFLDGNFDKASDILLGMLRKTEKLKPFPELATLYFELSGVYAKNGYFDIGKQYLLKGISIASAFHSWSDLSDGYNRLGGFYQKKTMLDSALFCYDTALALSYKYDLSLLGRSYCLDNIASVYGDKNEPEKALVYQREALEIREKTNDKLALEIIAINIGETYDRMNKYDSAIAYGQKTLELTKRYPYPQLEQYVNEFLSGLYEKKKDFKVALEYHKKSSQIGDSLFNATKSKQLAELNTKYQSEKKELEINKQKQQLRLRNFLLLFAVLMLLAVAIISYLVYNRRKLRAQSHLREELSKQQEITVREVLNAEERERRRIAGDLHDGVGQLLSASIMNLNTLFKNLDIHKGANEMADRSLALVTESYDELRTISHQMIPNALLKAGLGSAVKELLLKIDQDKLSVSLETTGLNEKINDEIETVLYRVIQESVNNVIKHSQATKLNIQMGMDREGIDVTIEDNGKGFDTNSTSHGIGLKNMLSRVQFHKGTIDIDSAPGKGTLIVIHIPAQ